MTKRDLVDEVRILNHNIQVLEERNNIMYLRLVKLTNYLIEQGLTDSDINKIIKLDCEVGDR